MSTAAALTTLKLRVTLLETKSLAGGRAGSFRVASDRRDVDYCQHVGMGCCTNFLHLLENTGQMHLWNCVRDPLFVGPVGSCSDNADSQLVGTNGVDRQAMSSGEHCRFEPSSWMPAPFHLLKAFNGLTYLSSRARQNIALGIWKLMRLSESCEAETLDMHTWLIERASQIDEAIDRFWNVILVSALGDKTKNVSVPAARKVIIDGFLANRRASEIWIPQQPLSVLFGDRLPDWLRKNDVQVRCGVRVKSVTRSADSESFEIETVSGEHISASYVVVAVPWHQLEKTVGVATAKVLDTKKLSAIPSSPITGIHLWFDRAITQHRHIAFVNRLSQWLFRPEYAGYEASKNDGSYYHQVVVSASHDLPEKHKLAEEVVGELKAIFPHAQDARLVDSRVVTDPNSVFSIRSNVERLRPKPETGIPNLWLAGDWTSTGWPSTMESAVISGYRAAEAVGQQIGDNRVFERPPLRREFLSKILIR